MTHGERASLIRKVFWIGLLLALALGAWIYTKPKSVAEEVSASGASPVRVYEDPLIIVLHHAQGNAESEAMAEIFARIQIKYGQQVVVTKSDLKTNAEAARAEGITRAPHVVISARGQRLFDFQGRWPYAQVERKVDELLHGLQRVGKDWRPAVPGMTRSGS